MDWIIEFLKTLVGSNFAWGTIIVLFIAKVLPNDAIEKLFGGLGEALSGFCNRWKWWQTVEDWLVGGLAVAITAFIKGLEKDNS